MHYHLYLHPSVSVVKWQAKAYSGI